MNDVSKRYPKSKTLEDYACWYNSANGQFFLTVPEQDANADTVALFNKVNGTSITAINES